MRVTNMLTISDPNGVAAIANELNTAEALAIKSLSTLFINWMFRTPPTREVADITTNKHILTNAKEKSTQQSVECF